ncbi:IscS subfamily cysteine desulfurase [bacterium]|nr:MAG: IscS subfamily cysteine desulfurase [bacterium]
MSVTTPVFLDHHATTPVDPGVLALIERVQREHFGNPASFGHAFGWAAAGLVATAREQVAVLVGGQAREIIFTGGATEANNLALLGTARRWEQHRRHLVISGLEHEAVSAPAAALTRQGWELTVVAGETTGCIDPRKVQDALRPDTALVSLMTAQNEIGTIQPVAEVGRICKARGILLHSDAAQAVGRIPVDVDELGVDLLSISAHKMHGPKGVGALWIRSRDPRVTIEPLLYGGGQERGLRPGTLNVPGIVGFGEACRIAAEVLPDESARLRLLRDSLLDHLVGELDGVHLNGVREPRLPGSLNVSVEGVPAHRLLGALTELAVSSSSACSSVDSEPSEILRALGRPDDLARASLRIGLGRFNTEEEITFAGRRIVEVVRSLRLSLPRK